MWTLETALPFIRKIAPVADGMGWGIFLGGSILHVGKSIKDVDLIVVSKNRSLPSKPNLMQYLERIGCKQTRFMRFPDRDVHVMEWEGKRIDFCFIDLTLMEYKEKLKKVV